MLIELVGGVIAGLIVGTITGLLPGIHINLIAAFIVSSSAILEKINPLSLVAFIVSLAITHTSLDFIPSVYLGAPTDETALSVLPGHELLKEGKGHEAVIIALYGTVAGILIGAILLPFFLRYSKIFQQAITNILPFILIGISLYVILREEKPIMAGVIFSLAGILGIVSLNQPINEPLLPLLTGLFGTSGMILSLKNNNKLPPQISTPLNEIKISRKELISVLIAAIVAAPIGSFLPALGSGYAALIGSEVRELSRKAFLFLNGLLNTTIMMMSFVMIFTLNKARTGAAAAISELLTKISISDLTIMLIISTITILCAFILGVYLSKVSAKFISQVSYPVISGMIIIFVTLLVVILSGFIGALVLMTATSLGIFTVRSNVKRTTLMGCLIVPTIIYYLI